MPAKFSVRKIWSGAIEAIAKKPVIILPFFIIAFLEGLALELIYFSNRKPVSLIAAPIIRKFSGEAFLHYPLNLANIPKLFLYTQVIIYILLGVFLAAISINILKNAEGGLPLKAKAVIKNASKRYFAFVAFGIIVIALMFLLGKADKVAYMRFMNLISKYIPRLTLRMQAFGLMPFSFFANLLMETFLVLTIPIVVIKKKSLLTSLSESIGKGFRHFFGIFSLIFLPYLLYLPVSLLKTHSPALIDKTHPEVVLIIIAAGIIISAFINCFVVVCATLFLLRTEIGLVMDGLGTPSDISSSVASPPAAGNDVI